MTDCFSDCPGVRIGHAHDNTACTGVTIIVPDRDMVLAVDVRGGGPGTRETDALDPSTLVDRVHGLALAGGSVFGLAAGDELALLLSAAGRGLAIGPGLPMVPVVPAAILFDLANGGDKAWDEPPYRALTRAAWAALGQGDVSGPVGAGHGARAGSRPGGIGSVSTRLADGTTIAALVAVNSFGEVYGGAPPDGPVPMPKRQRNAPLAASASGRDNTCIGVIATDAPLSRAEARRLAMMAQDGLARAIRPIHTPFDGDSLFVASTGIGVCGDPVRLAEIGTVAADLVARAVRRAVFGGRP